MEMKDGAQWVTRVHAGKLKRGERNELSAWLGASTENARDYLRAETIWRLSGGLANDSRVQGELERLREKKEERKESRIAYWGLAAGLLGVIAGILWFALKPSIAWYETAPGEQRSVTLGDGSTIAINTASRVGVDYNDSERSIVLERGEALFQVGKDARRPFVVRAGDGYVRALGTRFNVLMEDGAVTVAVLEGRVELSTQAHLPQPLRPEGQRGDGIKRVLDAGHAAAYGKAGDIREAGAREASRERIVAWREGKLRFDAWPLERAVREHNRYAVKPIRFGSPELKDVQVSGVFRVGDTDALVSALKQLIDVEVADEGDALVLRGPL